MIIRGLYQKHAGNTRALRSVNIIVCVCVWCVVHTHTPSRYLSIYIHIYSHIYTPKYSILLFAARDNTNISLTTNNSIAPTATTTTPATTTAPYSFYVWEMVMNVLNMMQHTVDRFNNDLFEAKDIFEEQQIRVSTSQISLSISLYLSLTLVTSPYPSPSISRKCINLCI